MPPRHRPRLTACGRLLHGVVVVENREDGRTRPLVSAQVSVVIDNGDVTSAATHRDGSYSIVVGLCRRQKQAIKQARLRVESVSSCEKVNATRIVKFETASFGNINGLLWQEDVKVLASETASLCEVSIDRASLQEAPDDRFPFAFEYEQKLKRAITGASMFFSLLWGFVLLWAIAKWATVNQPRRVNQVSDDECSFSDTQFTVTEVDEEKSSDRAISGRVSKLYRKERTIHHEAVQPRRMNQSSGYSPNRYDAHIIGKALDEGKSGRVDSRRTSNSNGTGKILYRGDSKLPLRPKRSRRRLVKMIDDDSSEDS